VRKPLIIILVFLSPIVLRARGGNETQGARSLALGGASLTLSDEWSPTNNVGSIGMVDRYSIGLGYETCFFLPEAGLRSVSAVLPLGGGSLGIVGHNYGFAGFANNRVGLSYGRKLSDYISLGVGVNYVQTRLGDVYGSRSNVVGEVGMLVMPSDKIVLAAKVYNPTRSKLADFNDERIPTVLSVAGQYMFSDKVSAMSEIEKDIDLPVNLKSGIEYSPAEEIFIRVGFATLQTSLGFGVGYKWKDLQADVSANWNQNLGYSSAISIAYRFGNRKKQE
jgi:opacity protein-like surface antigen